MTNKTQSDVFNAAQQKAFLSDMHSIMELLQMLKYNLQSFKENDIHKRVDKNKDMRPSCARLLTSINVYMSDMRKNCDPQTFNAITKTMRREQLHDLSLHMNEMFGVDNVEDFTAVLVEIKNKSKELKNEQQQQ